jgi:hypothetical protein
MFKGLEHLSKFERRVVFIFVFGGVLLAIIAVTYFLIVQALNSGRQQAAALVEGIAVSQFAALPDDDAYPAAVAARPDNTVYTGSYVTGAIWSISADGTPTEIPGTRDNLGSITGIAITPENVLLVIDRLDANPRAAGGVVRQITVDGNVSDFAQPNDEEGFVAPDDITLDGEGRIYVSDRGRDEVWRFEADGSAGVVWWTPPEGTTSAEPTGLAYDATTDSMIITDPEVNAIYRVSLDGATTTTLYQHGAGQAEAPGFDGVTVTPEGEIYVAALGLNQIGLLREDQLEYIAGGFRGASDVAYSEGKLYVSNFDQFSLVVSAVRPQLPFALDVITFAQ